MTAIAKIPFGLLDGALVEASSVANGKQCQCVCPGCGRPLIAYNSGVSRRAPHFGHQPGQECPKAVESALHLAAKEVLLREKRMQAPALRVNIDGIVVGSGAFHFQKVIEEPVQARYGWVEAEVGLVIAPPSAPVPVQPDIFGDDHPSEEPDSKLIRADIRAHRRYDTDWIEIRVTHAVDASKQLLLQQAGLRAIEVDLRRFLRQPVSLEDIRRAIVDDASGKVWLSHPGVPAALLEVEAQYEREAGRGPLAPSLQVPKVAGWLPADWRENLPLRRDDPFLRPVRKAAPDGD